MAVAGPSPHDQFCHGHHHREHHQHGGDQFDLSRVTPHEVSQGEADEHDRNRAKHHQPGHAAVGRAERFARGQSVEKPANEGDHVAAEGHKHRQQCARLNHGREGSPWVAPAEEPGHDQQVGRARNRQKLREPLHDP